MAAERAMSKSTRRMRGDIRICTGACDCIRQRDHEDNSMSCQEAAHRQRQELADLRRPALGTARPEAASQDAFLSVSIVASPCLTEYPASATCGRPQVAPFRAHVLGGFALHLLAIAEIPIKAPLGSPAT